MGKALLKLEEDYKSFNKANSAMLSKYQTLITNHEKIQNYATDNNLIESTIYKDYLKEYNTEILNFEKFKLTSNNFQKNLEKIGEDFNQIANKELFFEKIDSRVKSIIPSYETNIKNVTEIINSQIKEELKSASEIHSLVDSEIEDITKISENLAEPMSIKNSKSNNLIEEIKNYFLKLDKLQESAEQKLQDLQNLERDTNSLPNHFLKSEIEQSITKKQQSIDDIKRTKINVALNIANQANDAIEGLIVDIGDTDYNNEIFSSKTDNLLDIFNYCEEKLILLLIKNQKKSKKIFKKLKILKL